MVLAAAAAALPSFLILSCPAQNSGRIESSGWNYFNSGSNFRRPIVLAFANSADQDYSDTINNNKKKKRADTRIHWDNPDEGWIGVDEDTDATGGDSKDFKFGDVLGDILLETDNSHYQFLGVQPNADLEEIKAAYRRLSKEYHPDSTSLPLEKASKKFMRLKEAYDVLSREEQRRFYDWSLAQQTSGRQVVGFQQELANDLSPKTPFRSTPDLVDRLGGKNIKLSDQAMIALTFDAFVLLFTIGAIIYALFFKNQ